MLDIQNFLKKLSAYPQINFKGKESEMSLLAQKYDKNKNSIFEADELQTIKNDLLNYAREDRRKDDLSNVEAGNFLASLLPRGESLKNFKNKTGEKVENFVYNLLDMLNLSGIETNKENYIKNKIEELADKRTFNENFVERLSNFDAKQIEKSIELFYLNGRERQFSENEILRLMELNDKEFEQAKTLFQVDRERQFDGYEIASLASLSDKEMAHAKTLFHVDNRKEQFSGHDIADLAVLSDEELERAKTLFNVEDRETQFDGYGIAELAKLSDEELKRAKTLFRVDNRTEQFGGYDIARLAKLNDEELERAKTLFHVDNRKGQFCGSEIIKLAKLTDRELERAKTLFHVDNREQQFSGYEISELARLSDKELERAKTLFCIENEEEQLYGYETIPLAKLSDKELERAKTLLKFKNEKNLKISDIVQLSVLDDVEFERAKKLLQVENRDVPFTTEGILTLVNLDEEKFERAQSLLYVENREEQFNAYTIQSLVNLNNDEFERAKSLFYVDVREKQFSDYGILKLTKKSPEEFERVKSLFINNKFNEFDIDNLSSLSEEEFERAKTLFNVEDREKQFDGFSIATLSKLNDEEFEKAKTLFNVENRETQFMGSEIAELITLSEEEMERAKSLFGIKCSDADSFKSERFCGYEIAKLAKLDNDKFELAKTLFNVERLTGSEICALVQLSKEELEKAKTLFYVAGRQKQFNGYEIAKLIKLEEKSYKRAETLLNIENRSEELPAITLINIAKLDDDKFEWINNLLSSKNNNEFSNEMMDELIKMDIDDAEWVIKNLSDKSFSPNESAKITKFRNPQMEKFLKENNRLYIMYTAGDSIKLGSLEYEFAGTFNEDGLLETEKRESVDVKGFKNCTRTVNMNYSLNMEHEIIKGIPITTPDQYEIVLQETMTYFDNDGNIIKTVKLKRNPQDGTLNVSQTDKDGNSKPVQWQSVDPHTGAKITERHLVSAEGTKTDFYAEESKKLKITEYKITDKDGNDLINVYQTFEKKSKNEFISSINTTGDPKDTQTYKISYRKNNIIEIYDVKKKRFSTFSLNRYFKDEKTAQKLMPLIKQLPGHLLLKFLEKPFVFEYEHSNKQNGYWASAYSVIQAGNFDNTTGEEDNMLAMLTHEIGHYLDLYRTYESKFANNPEVIAIYKEEFEEFKKATTTIQQEYVGYFTNLESDKRGNEEKVAETHSLMYTTEGPFINTRRLYFAQYFPRTMAAIMKLLLEEEGVKVNTNDKN